MAKATKSKLTAPRKPAAPKSAKVPAKPKRVKPDTLPMPNRIPPRKPAARATKGKAAAEPIDYSGRAYLSAYDAETARTSGEQVQEVYRLKAAWESAHEKAAGLKKEYEAHRTEHLQYVRERIDARGKKPAHLFAEIEARETLAAASGNGKPKKGKKSKAETGGTGAGTLTPPPDAPDPKAWYPDDLWKRYPLDRLKPFGLTDSDLKALAECTVKRGWKGQPFAPIDTLGALVRFQEPDPVNGWTWKLSDIKGIGPASVERIGKATTVFWSEWPANLQELFAVEKGYRRPDPLAPEVATDEGKPADGGGSGTAGDGDGPGDPADDTTPGEDAAADFAFDADREAKAK